MNTTKRICHLVFALLALMHASFLSAQQTQKPKYAADVPEFLPAKERYP